LRKLAEEIIRERADAYEYTTIVIKLFALKKVSIYYQSNSLDH